MPEGLGPTFRLSGAMPLPTLAAASLTGRPAPPGPDAPLQRSRVRLSMYLAFAVLLLAVALQGRLTWQLEAVRSADAELLHRAGEERALAHRLGYEAALVLGAAASDADAALQLARLLAEAADSAPLLERLLSEQMDRLHDAGRQMHPALEGWHTARERLWSRARALLLNLQDPRSGAVQAAAGALHAEAGTAAEAATVLAGELRKAAESRVVRLRRDLSLGVAAFTVLLGLLALVVVEPTARSVARQMRRQQEQAAELHRLALVAEHTAALVLITDPSGRIQWVNAAFERASGWKLAEIAGRLPGSFLRSPGAETEVVERVRQALRRGAAIRQQWLHRNRQGCDLWLDVDLCPLRDDDGHLAGYVSVATDITASVLQQAKLQALWNALPAGVVVRNADHEVVEANPKAEQLLGLTLAQLQGAEPKDPRWRLLHEDLSEYTWKDHPALRTLASGEAVQNETVGVRLPSGETRWLLANIQPQRDAAGRVTAVVSCLSDITDRRALQEQLSLQACTDALTQLPNRAVVLQRLQKAIAHAARHPGYGFAVLYLDFDRFKQVNDTLGHAAGDDLLRQIAQRLQLAVRPGDVLARLEPDAAGDRVAARIGGDEFVVVLEGVNSAERVKAIADRVLEELSEPFLLGCLPMQGSASIGVVLHLGPTEGDAAQGDPQALAEVVMRNADTAMYEAKRAGRGRWVIFDDSMHERVVRTLAIESDLRRALREDELFVVYQPVLDLRSHALAGVEALVRWRHPERGLVLPVEFIGVAEDCGLIDEVGAFVLRKSCQQFVRWRSELGARAPQTLAVNVSRAQLRRPQLAEELRDLLKECGMQPSWLQLEITESLAAQDEPVQEALRRLKALGLTLALDDFGTGYSSLACLHQLPVDTVKVDRSFVQQAQKVEYHRVLIEATIRVARTLGMKTVAEGIETEGQSALMVELECDRGQGYLYSRPLEAAALAAWARSETAVCA